MPAQLIRYQAIVLRRTNFGEADRIVNFITPAGEVAALAKGVRKQKSKLAGGIELFCLTDVVIAKGKTDLGTLTSSRLIKYYSEIIKDYDRMQLAYQTLKYIARFANGIEDESWFNITQQVLEALDNHEIDQRLIWSWFNLKIAAQLGEPLNLLIDTSGQRISGSKKYIYDVSDKGLEANDGGNLELNHLKLLRLMAANDLDTVKRVIGIDSILGEIQDLSEMHASLN